MRAAVPITKMEYFRELLEENNFRLSDHELSYIPLPASQEQADTKEELSGRPILVVFDGTTRLGEAMAVVVHYIDTSFNIQ